jgi:hypothetical protein
MLLGKQYETIQGLSCGITADFDCGFMPTLLRHHCLLDFLSHRTTCGIIADLWLTATFPLLWDLAALFTKLASILGASSPTCCGIIANFHLRSQALVTSLSSYDIIVDHCGTHADLRLAATFPLL